MNEFDILIRTNFDTIVEFINERNPRAYLSWAETWAAQRTDLHIQPTSKWARVHVVPIIRGCPTFPKRLRSQNSFGKEE